MTRLSNVQGPPSPRWVVLGAKGFLGSAFSAALHDAGQDLIAVDTSPGVTILESDLRPGGQRPLRFRSEDMRETGSIESPAGIFIDATGGITPASSASIEEGDFFEERLESLVGRIEAAAQAGATKYCLCSSGGAVYGSRPGHKSSEDDSLFPNTKYGDQKRKEEEITLDKARQLGMGVMIWRFSNVYGPTQQFKRGQGVIPRIIECFEEDLTFDMLVNGSTVRDYILLEDAIDTALKVVKVSDHPDVVNVGTGEGTSVSELISLAEGIYGRSLKKRPIFERQDSESWNVLDISRLTSLIGPIDFVPIERGMRLVVERLHTFPDST